MNREDKERIRRAVLAVLDVANSNFPGKTSVTISAIGQNTASVTLADYELRELVGK